MAPAPLLSVVLIDPATGNPISSTDPLYVSGGASGPVAGVPSNYVPIAIDNTGTNNSTLYIGYAVPGTAESAASWAIKKLGYDSNGNVNQVFWGNISAGIPAQNLVFNNRATGGYTYS